MVNQRSGLVKRSWLKYRFGEQIWGFCFVKTNGIFYRSNSQFQPLNMQQILRQTRNRKNILDS